MTWNQLLCICKSECKIGRMVKAEIFIDYKYSFWQYLTSRYMCTTSKKAKPYYFPFKWSYVTLWISNARLQSILTESILFDICSHDFPFSVFINILRLIMKGLCCACLILYVTKLPQNRTLYVQGAAMNINTEGILQYLLA